MKLNALSLRLKLKCYCSIDENVGFKLASGMVRERIVSINDEERFIYCLIVWFKQGSLSKHKIKAILKHITLE